jgi:hypothetical protein
LELGGLDYNGNPLIIKKVWHVTFSELLDISRYIACNFISYSCVHFHFGCIQVLSELFCACFGGHWYL